MSTAIKQEPMLGNEAMSAIQLSGPVGLRSPSGMVRSLLLATTVFCSSILLSGDAKSADITAVVDGGALVITGSDQNDKIRVLFNRRNNNSLWVRVTNAFGKVNSNGSTGGGGQDFELSGISTIRVALRGGIDILSIEHGNRDFKDWGGNLDLNFGSRPSTGSNENLIIRGSLRLGNIVIRGNHNRRNDTIDNNVFYDSLRKL